MRNALLFFGLLLLIGCSSGNPATTPNDGISQSTAISSSSILGAYNLIIDSSSMSAEMTPVRIPSIGQSWTLSGRSFFNTFPCQNCFQISGLGYEDGLLAVDFTINHPFPKGNLMEPPSGRNRLDLDLFDLACVIAPESQTPAHFSLANFNVYDDYISNPDGFTTELSMLALDMSAMPYKLVIDDSMSIPPSNTFNKFEMESGKNFQMKFRVEPGETLVFDLYLTFGYGASADFESRLNPVYYNPEFNRKSSWKVTVTPPNGTEPPEQGNTWDNTNSTTTYDVTVKVYDWQIGANVNQMLTNPSDVYAASEIDHIAVEIPGMTDTLKQVGGDSYAPGGTGMPDSPLVYNVPIANENHLAPGEYVGLVIVYDERIPQGFPQGRDYLIHSPDGKTLNQITILNYRTYQTFIATVVEGSTTSTGNLILAKRAGGSDLDEGDAITSLSDNSVVVAGTFGTTATFGQGEPNQKNLTAVGSCDVFIARYNPDGTLAWAKSAGGVDYDECPGITALSDNSVVVTGYFYSPTITFAKGEANETTLNNHAGELDIYIAKYNPDGTLAWAKVAGGNADDCAYAITACSDDSTVVTGFYYETATFGKNETHQTTLISDGGDGWIDIFIAKYNPNGTLEWAKSAGGPGDDEGYGITTLSDNSTVATGYFGDTHQEPATFGKGETNQTLLTPVDGKDIFIAKYNSNGTLAWAKRAGYSNEEGSKAIASLTDNSTVLTGYYVNSTVFGPGEANETTLTSVTSNDIFIARLNTDGTLAWAKSAGGPTWQDDGSGIAALSDNSCVITGFFNNSATFAPGESNETVLTSTGEVDIFIAKYSSDGSLVWVKNQGGEDWEKGFAITSLPDNSIAATGWFLGDSTFGAGETNETTLTAFNFYSDIFVARFEP
jgi:uncharacterized delta-60 repeat protein